MKVFLSILVFLLKAQAAETWENCLDYVNFRYDAGALTSHVMSKDGCTLKFVISGIKPEKFEVNLCDKDIHIKGFARIDALESTRIRAGSANCALPMFGSDNETLAGDALKYDGMKKRIYSIYEEVEKIYGTVPQDKLKAMKNLENAPSEYKLTCVKQLMDSYLNSCNSFQERKIEKPHAPIDPKDLPPGVHPETIQLKK